MRNSPCWRSYSWTRSSAIPHQQMALRILDKVSTERKFRFPHLLWIMTTHFINSLHQITYVGTRSKVSRGCECSRVDWWNDWMEENARKWYFLMTWISKKLTTFVLSYTLLEYSRNCPVQSKFPCEKWSLVWSHLQLLLRNNLIKLINPMSAWMWIFN
jgi:hypothetical protein